MEGNGKAKNRERRAGSIELRARSFSPVRDSRSAALEADAIRSEVHRLLSHRRKAEAVR